MSASCHCPRRKLTSPLLVAAAIAIGAAVTPDRLALADPVPEQRAYGDAGTSELSFQLGAGSNYFAVGAGFRTFIVDGIAPGLEASYQRSSGLDEGLVMASLRLAPLRFGTVVPVATARAGRVFLSNHADGWAVGVEVGALILISPHVAFEVGYSMLHFLPASFCADLSDCTIYQPTLGLRITF
jgi:hypothetical protein